MDIFKAPLLNFMMFVDYKYSMFVLPFIYFASKYNPDCMFEIYFVDSVFHGHNKGCNLDDLKIYKDLVEGVKFLSERGICRNIFLYKVNSGINPLYLRFLLEPVNVCLYTYLGDIDILICEDIVPFHSGMMNLEGCIFDNRLRPKSVRGGKPRLTGLHFVKTEPYFSETRLIRNKYLGNFKAFTYGLGDENMLYHICRESGLRFPRVPVDDMDLNKLRPVHGHHLSLNRRPFKVNSPMAVVGDGRFISQYKEAVSEDLFKDMLNLEICYGFKEIKSVFDGIIG